MNGRKLKSLLLIAAGGWLTADLAWMHLRASVCIVPLDWRGVKKHLGRQI